MRTMTSAVITQLSSGQVLPIVFVEIDFSGGTIYIWSGTGSISWNSHTWTGTGNLGSISAISETSDVQASNITLSLSGMPSSLVDEALNECRQNKPVKLWLGFMNSSGGVIADPVQSFAGRMDVPTIDDSGETCTISITVENRLIDLRRPRVRRYTDADQRRTLSTDAGFQFVSSIQEWNGVWGKR